MTREEKIDAIADFLDDLVQDVEDGVYDSRTPYEDAGHILDLIENEEDK